jgi:kynureninase
MFDARSSATEACMERHAALRHADFGTPADPERRGAQLSLRIGGPLRAGELARRLRFEYGVIADTREPDVLRLAPVPLYSTYHDCWRAASALTEVVSA